jgi:hypothetical protein
MRSMLAAPSPEAAKAWDLFGKKSFVTIDRAREKRSCGALL